MAENNFVVNRMTIDYNLKPFDCGDSDINDFLLNDAHLYLKEHLSVTYIIENDIDTIAYFSVQNDKIALNDFATGNQFNNARKQIPRKKMHKSYPAVKIGRLGVSQKYSGQGYASMLIDYIKILFVTDNRTGCRFMLVDSYLERIGMYEKCGFKLLKKIDDSSPTQLMYCDLIILKNFN